MIELVKFKNGSYGIKNKDNEYLSFASCRYWFPLRGNQDLCQTSYQNAKHEYDKLTSNDFGEVVESSDKNVVANNNVSSETSIKSKKLTNNLMLNNTSRFFAFFSIFK